MCFISSADGEHSWLPLSGRLCVLTTHVRAPEGPFGATQLQHSVATECGKLIF